MNLEEKTLIICECYREILINKKEATAYLAILHKYLTELTAKDQLACMTILRERNHYYTDETLWPQLDVALFTTETELFSGEFWVWLTCHPNGYVREYALRKITRDKTENSLPFILFLLNDHISELRTIASICYSKSIEESAEGEVIRSLLFIERLQKLSRMETKAAYLACCQMLTSKPNLLLQAQEHEELPIARFAFRLSNQVPEIRKLTIEKGLGNKDWIIATQIAKELMEEVNGIEKYKERLSKHPQTAVRKLIIEWFYNQTMSERLMIECLMDDSKALKSLAIRYVERNFPAVAIDEYYREHLGENELNALQGLSLLKNKKDQDILLNYVNDPRKVARKSVLDWAAALPKEEQRILYYQGIQDSANLVRRKAEEELKQQFDQTVKANMLALFKETPEERKQLNILYVLKADNRKEYLITLLRLYPQTTSEKVRSFIEREVASWSQNWNQRFFFQFWPAEQAEIRQLAVEYPEYSAEIWKVINLVIGKV